MIVTVANLKEHSRISGTGDDLYLDRLILSAQSHIEALLGYALEERYPPAGSPAVSTVPAPLAHAVLMLAAHWYENREATLIGVSAVDIPHGVWEIVTNYRNWWGVAANG